jgi:hypothetical protein
MVRTRSIAALALVAITWLTRVGPDLGGRRPRQHALGVVGDESAALRRASSGQTPDSHGNARFEPSRVPAGDSSSA